MRWSPKVSARPSICVAISAGLQMKAHSSEIHKGWARELVVGFARLDGKVVGLVANNPMFKGGVLFVDSADKATLIHPVVRCLPTFR